MASQTESPEVEPVTEADADPGADTHVHLRTRAMQKPRRDALTRVRHDLRSLVHSVVGYSELLVSPSYGALTTDQARFVGYVRTAAEQLQELVDTCIELSRPAGEVPALSPTRVPLGAVLEHVRANLAHESLPISLEVDDAAAGHVCELELPHFLRALRGLTQVATREGKQPCTLRATAVGCTVALQLAADGPAPLSGWSCLDALEDDVGNRDFVRLKLSEVLLQRLGVSLRLTPELDRVELRFA